MRIPRRNLLRGDKAISLRIEKPDVERSVAGPQEGIVASGEAASEHGVQLRKMKSETANVDGQRGIAAGGERRKESSCGGMKSVQNHGMSRPISGRTAAAAR